MSALLAGLAVLGLLLLLARAYTHASPKGLAKGFRFSAGAALAVLTLILGFTGRLALAFITAAGAWFLLFGTQPPWLGGPSYGSSRPGTNGSRTRSTPPRRETMSRAEALHVLGLKEGASDQDIRAAHRRLIVQTHPDKGGTDYLAAKINQAKDVLLNR